MKKWVLLGGILALVVGGGPVMRVSTGALSLGLFGLAALLAVAALVLAVFWAAPFPPPKATRYAASGGEAAEGPLLVPVLCYRSNGQVDWLLGELLPGPTS
jgi:hypothetical protein